MSKKTITLEPDAYHELTLFGRDHLLAAALLNRRSENVPAASTVTDTVGRITGDDSPTDNTTRAALHRLEEGGLIERVDGQPVGNARGVRVTEQGYRVLTRAAARLGAVASD